MKTFIASTLVLLATVGQISASEHTTGPVESNKSPDAVQAVFQIAAQVVPCLKGGPAGQSIQARCLVVNGETFYDRIDGYIHQIGVGRTIKIERIQICDPDLFNSCPHDIGSIYSYRLLEIISAGETTADESSQPNPIDPESR